MNPLLALLRTSLLFPADQPPLGALKVYAARLVLLLGWTVLVALLVVILSLEWRLLLWELRQIQDLLQGLL